jgi:hypothetical protein
MDQEVFLFGSVMRAAAVDGPAWRGDMVSGILRAPPLACTAGDDLHARSAESAESADLDISQSAAMTHRAPISAD